MSLNAHALIDTANLRHNLACVRQLSPRSRVLAMIKADAYGHGVSLTLDVLADADALGVAHLGEALELREQSNAPIVILEGFVDADEWQLCLQRRLTPVLHHAGQLRLMRENPPPPGFQAWIKFDTGMHRLGFRCGELPRVLDELRALQPRLGLTLMTHFARSEELDNDCTARQIAEFRASADGTGLPLSMANSAAVVARPDSRRDWVRPGLMLYGARPCETSLDLRPVMTLRSRVIGLRELQPGEEVGYNGRWRASRPSRIATVAIGYADGYTTHFRDGTPVLVNGRRALLAGRPSMDMITVDVSEIGEVRIGDPVVLWGEGLPIHDVAPFADTISYELLTGVGKRVPRILRAP